MSRSYRKTPIFGNCIAHSEKEDKRLANRKWRRITKQAIKSEKEPPRQREVSDIWKFKKDGKRYFRNFHEKWMRK